MRHLAYSALILLLSLALLLLVGCTKPAQERTDTPPPVAAVGSSPSPSPRSVPAYPKLPSRPTTSHSVLGPGATVTPMSTMLPTSSTNIRLPTPTWGIIVPATALPGMEPPVSPWPTVPYEPAPTVQVPDERYQAYVAALEVLPDVQPLLHPTVEGKRVEVQTMALLQLDINEDQREEVLWIYFIHSLYDTSYLSHYIYGYLGQAIFDDQDGLLWHSAPEDFESDKGDRGLIRVDISPVFFAPGEVGVLYNLNTACYCEGAVYNQTTTVYRWNGSGLEAIWQRPTAGGGNMGAGYSFGMAGLVEFQDIDGDAGQELLLQRLWGSENRDYRPRWRDCRLYLPGQVVFRWDSASYVPAYWMDQGQVTSIHAMPIYYAPRFSVPITLDGNDEDWWQVEYREGLLLPSNEGEDPHGQIRHDFDVAWDQDFLYIYYWDVPRQGFSFALDSDLVGDLNEKTRNEDDFVWHVAVSDSLHCQDVMEMLWPGPSGAFEGSYRTLARSGPPVCTIEIAIPLDALALSGEGLVPEIGWVVDTSPYFGVWGQRSYYPRAGRVIGFAIEPGYYWQPFPDYRWDDPTTWSTLVFIADR